jgi:hypothetical protein
MLRGWSSPADASLKAAELFPAPMGGEALASALSRVAGQLDGAAFLIVRVSHLDAEGLRSMVANASAASPGPRLCLAADRATLKRLDMAMFDGDRVGLLLDEVDADMPLAEIVRDRIEAIRFSADFVARAGRSLRLGCALDAMLGLARNLGLCTLGGVAMPGRVSSVDNDDFDYVPSQIAAAPSVVSLPKRSVAAAHAPARFQVTR